MGTGDPSVLKHTVPLALLTKAFLVSLLLHLDLGWVPVLLGEELSSSLNPWPWALSLHPWAASSCPSPLLHSRLCTQMSPGHLPMRCHRNQTQSVQIDLHLLLLYDLGKIA